MPALPIAIRRVVSSGLVCLAIGIALPRPAAADPVTEDVPIPGGLDVVAGMLGVRPTPDAARFVSEIVRIAYTLPEKRNADFRRNIARFEAAAPKLPPTDDVVPVPLSAAIWSRAVFGRAVTSARLFGAILGDRDAALLCYGLAGLDDPTLEYLGAHPGILSQVYKKSAGVFAASAGSLHIRSGRVVPAGGDPAVPLWESVVGQSVADPVAFIPAWLALDEGRAAYLSDTIAQLDPPQARFVLGAWITDPARRLGRFSDLLAAIEPAVSGWNIELQPFSRPNVDVASLFWRVRAEPSGAPLPPASRGVWARAFGDVDRAAPPAPDDDEPFDADWLLRAILKGDRQGRSARLGQITFGQRVFSDVGTPAPPDVVTALAAYTRFPALMLALERAGARSPAVYAAAARRATAIDALDGVRAYAALGEYQGALVLVSRMVRARTLNRAAGESLIRSLTAVPIGDDGWYGGAIADWLTGTLVPDLPAKPGVEETIVAALGGAATPDGVERHVEWEGQAYRLDLGAGERTRLERVRRRQATEPIDSAVEVAVLARRLAAGQPDTDAVAAAGSMLQHLSDDIARDPTASVSPDGLDLPDAVSVMHQTIAALSQVDDEGGVPAAHAIEPLRALGEVLLARSLISVDYALGIGDPDGTVLLAGDISRRHDFGFAPHDLRDWTRFAWTLPQVQVTPGNPWHVTGSLLGIDVALGSLTLRRIDSEHPIPPPTLTLNERDTVTAGVALMDPLELDDASSDRLASAIDRGQARITALSGPGPDFDAVADAVRLDGWRRRAVAWALGHDRGEVDSFFSLEEFLELGGGAGAPPPAGWGTSAIAGDDCLCLELVPASQWKLRSGRPPLGLLATAMSDLNLRVALVLQQLRLPAALGKDVLRSAAQDFEDEVRPTDPDDWLALVRAARALSRDRIEDYVAASAAAGPLVPEGK
jgi:hypothetical protein